MSSRKAGGALYKYTLPFLLVPVDVVSLIDLRKSSLSLLCSWTSNLTNWAKAFGSPPIEANDKTSNDLNESKLLPTISRWTSIYKVRQYLGGFITEDISSGLYVTENYLCC